MAFGHKQLFIADLPRMADLPSTARCVSSRPACSACRQRRCPEADRANRATTCVQGTGGVVAARVAGVSPSCAPTATSAAPCSLCPLHVPTSAALAWSITGRLPCRAQTRAWSQVISAVYAVGGGAPFGQLTAAHRYQPAQHHGMSLDGPPALASAASGSMHQGTLHGGVPLLPSAGADVHLQRAFDELFGSITECRAACDRIEAAAACLAAGACAPSRARSPQTCVTRRS